MSLTAIMGLNYKNSADRTSAFVVLCIVAVWKTAGIIPMKRYIGGQTCRRTVTIPMGISIVSGKYLRWDCDDKAISAVSTKKDCAIRSASPAISEYIRYAL